MRQVLSKIILDLNRYFSKSISKNNYFFFVKYFYPLFLLKIPDLSLNFSFIEKNNLLKVKSSFSKTDGFYYNIERSNRYIFGGFDGIGKKLYEKYLLQKIEFNHKDIVIDIGANVGELTNYLSRFNPLIYALDIEDKALDCLKLNCSHNKKIKIQKLAIWKTSGILKFDSRINEASSSLLKPKNKNAYIKKIKALTLDRFFLENNIKKVRLLKIEAEGGEPEVLQGAKKKVLDRIDYITLDCGAERYGKTTFRQVIQILKKNNFKIVKTTNQCCLAANKKLF